MPTNLEIETHILELKNCSWTTQNYTTSPYYRLTPTMATHYKRVRGNSWQLPMLHRYFNSTGEIYTTSFAIKTVGETDTFGDLLDAMIQEPHLYSHGNTGIWFWNCMTATSCLVLWSYSRRSSADQPRIKYRRCHTIWVVGLEHNPKKSPRSANISFLKWNIRD